MFENAHAADISSMPQYSKAGHLSFVCQVLIWAVHAADYMSPEMILGKALLDPKAADIWSLGVMLYAMLAGQMPFKVLNT